MSTSPLTNDELKDIEARMFRQSSSERHMVSQKQYRCEEDDDGFVTICNSDGVFLMRAHKSTMDEFAKSKLQPTP